MENTLVKTVLTAEEWKARSVGDRSFRVWLDGEDLMVTTEIGDPGENLGETLHLYGEYRSGVAALALHGQPFGFTREDVDSLRDLRHNLDEDLSMLAGTRFADGFLKELADRIEALLPPEK